MNAKHRIMMTYLLLAADVALIILSFILGAVIRFGNLGTMEDKLTYFGACAIFVMTGILYALVFDHNRDFLKRGRIAELGQVLRCDAVVTIAGLVILYTMHTIDTISRLVVGYYFLFDLVLTFLAHLAIRRGMRAYWRSSDNSIRVLVISERENMEACIRRLKNQLDISFRLVGAVCADEDLTGETIEELPVIADREHLIEVATPMPLDEVFICTPDIPQRQLSDIIGAFNDMGVVVHFSLEMGQSYGGSAQTGMFGNYSVISYTHITGRHRGLLLKRLMDIVGGFIGLLITAVITPFVALAIHLDSPGPVFFSQTRIGRNGRRFVIYKFRSMYTDAEARKKELMKQNEMQGPIFKIENDPRVTHVGSFLRRTSIDEFPQFLNVLRGDMSLVGTRPPTEDEFSKYDPHDRRRLSMTPGLTGLWQVSGRSEVESFEDVLRYDLKYIDHWSLKLDLWILCKTVGVVLSKRGAS